MVEGFNATQRELEILELRKEVSALKTNVEYWRLAAERRDTRKELTGLDVPEARTLDAPEPPQCEVQSEPVAYRWKYEDERSWTLSKSKPDHLFYKDIICEPLYPAPAQAVQDPYTLAGMIGKIYDGLDAEDCSFVDFEWARQRGYILPNNGTGQLSKALLPFLCPRCGARGTTDGKASTVSSASRGTEA